MKKEEFKYLFYKKYPNFKLLKFTNLTSEIEFIDDEGYLHKKSLARRVLTHNVRMDSIIDKCSYIQDKIKLKFPDLKLIEFNGMKKNVLVEDSNGFIFTPQCHDLISGHPVSIQTCTNKYEYFVFKANNRHNSYYNYPIFNYKNGKQKIEILCPIHGSFYQSIESHLYGRGCPLCNKGGFSKESWLKRLKDKECCLYVLKIFDENESFIKIGITSKSIEKRFKPLINYKFSELFQIKGNASEIYDLEKELLKRYKHYKYFPKKEFAGKTECFSIKILTKLYEQFKQ